MQYDIDNIYYLPLDIPNLELLNFTNNFTTYATTLPEVTKNNYSNGIQGKITSNINYWDQWLAFSNGKWDEVFKELYPTSVSLFRELPYDKLIRIYFFKQIKTVDPHIDFVTGLYTSYPSAMRYWVVNEDLDTTFYFQNDNIKIFPIYPTTSNWWIMNSTAIKHGSNMPTTTEKIILGIYGIPNYNQLTDLISNSMKKYSEFALYKDDFSSKWR